MYGLKWESSENIETKMCFSPIIYQFDLANDDIIKYYFLYHLYAMCAN